MIDRQIFFDHMIKIHMIKINIQKVVPYQGEDYPTYYLFNYNYSKYYYEMTAIDLSKQQALDADPKTIN